AGLGGSILNSPLAECGRASNRGLIWTVGHRYGWASLRKHQLSPFFSLLHIPRGSLHSSPGRRLPAGSCRAGWRVRCPRRVELTQYDERGWRATFWRSSPWRRGLTATWAMPVTSLATCAGPRALDLRRAWSSQRI